MIDDWMVRLGFLTYYCFFLQFYVKFELWRLPGTYSGDARCLLDDMTGPLLHAAPPADRSLQSLSLQQQQ